MNKLLSDVDAQGNPLDGGFPLCMDDTRWMDDAYRQAFNDIMKGIAAGTANPVILHGVSFDYSNSGIIIINEGSIYYNNEVYHVNSQILTRNPAQGSVLYLRWEPQYDPDGNVVFEDGVSHNIHQIRRAFFEWNTSQPTNSLPWEDWDVLLSLISHTHPIYALKQQEAWHQVGASGEPAFTSGWQNVDTAVYNPLSFMKDQSGFVHIKGAVVCPSGPLSGWSNKITTLPTAYHPSKDIYVVGFIKDGEEKYGTCLFRIDADGSLYYNHVSTPVGIPSIIDLGHIIL